MQILNLLAVLATASLLQPALASEHSGATADIRKYKYEPDPDEEYHTKGCHSSCGEGGCRYEYCGRTREKIANPVANCEGGLCEFTECEDASCDGGSCIFVNSKRSTCHGGGCHHVQPKDTLTDGYCTGGGCRLNGEAIPATLKDSLSQ